MDKQHKEGEIQPEPTQYFTDLRKRRDSEWVVTVPEIRLHLQ